MTDVSTTHTNAALPTTTSAAKSIKSNNDTICHATADTTSSTKQVTTVRKISLTNGSTAKINSNTEKIPTTTTTTTTITTDTVNLTTETTSTSKLKMSTVGVKTAPTPTTQSPVTTQPNQAVVACSYNLNLTATSTTTTTAAAAVNTKQTNQLIAAKPALQTDKEAITPDTIAIIATHSSASASASASASPSPSPTISTGRYCSPTTNSSNPFLKTVSPRQQLREATAQDVDEVARLFEEKPEAFEKWLMERAPPEALARLHEFIESRKQPPKRPSVTSDLFQQWMSSSSPIPYR